MMTPQVRCLSEVIKDKRLAFIGGGKMCEALVRGMMSGNANSMMQRNAVVVDPHITRRNVFSELGIEAVPSVNEKVFDADVVTIAVKPQHSVRVLKGLEGKLKPHALFISIMAGVTTDDLMGTGTTHVVRTMPNTPALIRQGMTVWYPSRSVADEPYHKTMAKAILSSIGEEQEVTHEDLMDCATAISGVGPAYMFMLMEAMADTGVHMGFSRDVSLKLVQQTALGASMLSVENSQSPTGHRRTITSPAGATAAAMYAMDRGNFRTCVHDAIWAACRRSLELGGKDSNVGPGRHV